MLCHDVLFLAESNFWITMNDTWEIALLPCASWFISNKFLCDKTNMFQNLSPNKRLCLQISSDRFQPGTLPNYYHDHWDTVKWSESLASNRNSNVFTCKFSWNMAISEKKKNLSLTSMIFYYYFNPYNSQEKYKWLRLVEKLDRQTNKYQV